MQDYSGFDGVDNMVEKADKYTYIFSTAVQVPAKKMSAFMVLLINILLFACGIFF